MDLGSVPFVFFEFVAGKQFAVPNHASIAADLRENRRRRDTEYARVPFDHAFEMYIGKRRANLRQPVIAVDEYHSWTVTGQIGANHRT